MKSSCRRNVRITEDLLDEARLLGGAVNGGLSRGRLGLLLEAHERRLNDVKVGSSLGLGDAEKARHGLGEPLALQAGLLGSRSCVHLCQRAERDTQK